MLILIPLLFMTGIVIGYYVDVIPGAVMYVYLVASTGSVLFYGVDKFAARKRRHRVAEKTLHLIALVGGWPGAMLAQQWFRHKTIKRTFRIRFWLTACVNMVVVSALLLYVHD